MKACIYALILCFFFIHKLPTTPHDRIFPCSNKEKIEESIFEKTNQIRNLEINQGVTEEVLWLYNELGIDLFFLKDYLSALKTFDYILSEKMEDNHSLLIGASLWGKAICHACLDMSEEMIHDFEMLEIYFDHLFQCDCLSMSSHEPLAFSKRTFHSSDLQEKTKVVLANPSENISASECRERVRGSAKALKLFIGPLIKDPAKRAIFYAFIENLEAQGVRCCRHGTIWATCVMPLLQKLQDWKAFGIPSDPAWD